MFYVLQWILSLFFVAQMYVAILVVGVIFIPLAVFDRRFAFMAVRVYCQYVRLTARLLVGLKTEIRGEVPTGGVLVASKHQSFLDIIMIASVLERPKFIMKKQLAKLPILGFFARKLGCVAVDRGRKRAAIIDMVAEVKAGMAQPGQLVIFPQGTVLYEETGQACVPAATNVGVFWPRHGIYRKRGTAVVEFLQPIKSGKKKDVFMQELETSVETASDALMIDAGFNLS